MNLITDITGTQRRHDIDWLRVLAVLMLFPFHTARVFNFGEEFYVKGDQLSNALSHLVTFMEPWHMPLLFLLAGASSWYALSHRRGRAYAGERLKRLMVPFAFGLLVIIPPQSYLGLLTHGGSADSYLSWLPNFFSLNPNDMDGYFLGGHTWGHLWFVFHLFLYSLIALPIMLVLRREGGRRLIGWLAKAVEVPGVILLLGLFTLGAQVVPEMGGGNPAWYVPFFLLGYVMMADERFGRAIDRHRHVALVLGPLALLVINVMHLDETLTLPGWAGDAFELYLEGFLPWLCLVALLGYGRRLLDTGSRFLSYAAEGSYAIYILHQTVVVAVASFVVRWEVGALTQFAAIVLGSLAGTAVVYELLIRRFNIVRFLFGMKAGRRRPTPQLRPSGADGQTTGFSATSAR